MTQSQDTMRWPQILAVLLIALGAWLFLGTDFLSPAARDADSDRDTRIENAEMLGGGEAAVRASHGELTGNPQSASSRARGPVTVTLLGPAGAPLAHVPLILREKQDASDYKLREATTDQLGRAVWQDVSYDGRAIVYLGRQQKESDPEDPWGQLPDEKLPDEKIDVVASVVVKAHAVTLRSPVGLRIDLQPVDAVTGRTLRGLKGGIWPGFAGLGGRVASHDAPVAVARGMRCAYLIALAPPEGYLPHGSVHVVQPIHPDVNRATHVVALHKEADLVLVAKRGATLPSLVDSTLQVGNGRQHRKVEYREPDGFGRVVVRGVRFVPHVPVYVHWRFPGGGVATGEGRFGATYEDGLVIELDVRTPVSTDGGDEDIEESFETDNDLEHEESFGDGEGSARVAPGQVILDIERPDGTPATLASVEFGTVRAVIRPRDMGRRSWLVRHGEYELLVWGAGADMRATIDVGPDATKVVRLRGTEGGRLRVSVKNKRGNQLPHARVTIVGPTHWAQSDVKDGHQRLDALTDVRGTRTFHRVAVGRCKVSLRYGGFHFTTAVEIRAGRTTRLDFVMDLSR